MAFDLRVLPARATSRHVGVAKVKVANDDAPATFGAWLKRRMAQKGLNAVALSAATADHPLGPVNPSTISNLRNDKTPPGFEVLTKLHEPLGVTLAEALVAAGLSTLEKIGVDGPELTDVERQIRDRLGPRSPLNERQKQRLIGLLVADIEFFDDAYAEVVAIRAGLMKDPRS
jgi:transcriptional regulator with XRE-family HTH domain